MVVLDQLHTMFTYVSQEGDRLLINKREFNSTSIVIPCAESWEFILSHSLMCAWAESDSFI